MGGKVRGWEGGWEGGMVRKRVRVLLQYSDFVLRQHIQQVEDIGSHSRRGFNE